MTRPNSPTICRGDERGGAYMGWNQRPHPAFLALLLVRDCECAEHGSLS